MDLPISAMAIPVSRMGGVRSVWGRLSLKCLFYAQVDLESRPHSFLADVVLHEKSTVCSFLAPAVHLDSHGASP